MYVIELNRDVFIVIGSYLSHFFFFYERRMNQLFLSNYIFIRIANASYDLNLWNFIRNINHFMNDLHIYVWVMVTEFSSGPLSGVSQIFLQGCRHLDCLVQENVFSRLKGKDEVDWEWRIRTCLRMRKAKGRLVISRTGQ